MVVWKKIYWQVICLLNFLFLSIWAFHDNKFQIFGHRILISFYILWIYYNFLFPLILYIFFSGSLLKKLRAHQDLLDGMVVAVAMEEEEECQAEDPLPEITGQYFSIYWFTLNWHKKLLTVAMACHQEPNIVWQSQISQAKSHGR